jgi:hypothetical protein
VCFQIKATSATTPDAALHRSYFDSVDYSTGLLSCMPLSPDAGCGNNWAEPNRNAPHRCDAQAPSDGPPRLHAGTSLKINSVDLISKPSTILAFNIFPAWIQRWAKDIDEVIALAGKKKYRAVVGKTFPCLGVPAIKGDEVVGMIGVANRPGEYAQTEQLFPEMLILDLLFSTTGIVGRT